MQPHVVSVAEFLALINHALRTIPCEEMVLEGEVADYKVSQGKWVNFDLKDEKSEAKISCFSTVFQLPTPLAAGMRVQAKGYPRVFERFGKLSFNVDSVTPVGEGALGKAYELLKKKLADEGLFDVPRKRAIPQFPQTIGLITSKEAAAYGDFMRILSNRWSGVTVLHAPVHVQGQFAVPEILAAFTTFNAMPDTERPDVIVLTRGGGSLEELHAFNDEQVARAVFGSLAPVVVGVGHERDESLCDFVADVRASTPSNAAERVVPDRRDVLRGIDYAVDHMAAALGHRIDRHADRMDRATRVIDRFFADIATKLAYAERLLASVDPERVLERGYAIVRKGDTVVRDGGRLAGGDRLSVQFARGSANVRVEKDTLL
ncbi:exodeoxyribonuclease VII large subunit [Candidatus Uhrbacteria bacterium]|nr:exodeoxyribonuclease VII large subunit [Candidatus Uhrbacteria bacterium]